MPSAAPIFSWDKYFWVADVTLPSWKGFQNERDVYGNRVPTEPSDGIVEIAFAPEGRGDAPLNAAELALVGWVIDNEAAIAKALLSSLLNEYPRLRDKYDYTAEEKADLMPEIHSVDDLRPLIGLSGVNVHQVQKDGLPYAGFLFDCPWEREHALGVLMHGTRPVEIGWGDTAISLWIAEEDGGIPLGD